MPKKPKDDPPAEIERLQLRENIGESKQLVKKTQKPAYPLRSIFKGNE